MNNPVQKPESDELTIQTIDENIPVMKTTRLLLRPLQKDDAVSLALLRSNPVVNEFIIRAKYLSIKDAGLIIDKIQTTTAENRWYYWAISHLQSTRLIGTICLWKFSDDRRTAEVGYELLPGFTGKGLMSEALLCVLSFAQKELNLQTIQAYTHKNNQNSIHLLQKNLFTHEPGETYPDDENYLLFTKKCEQRNL